MGLGKGSALTHFVVTIQSEIQVDHNNWLDHSDYAFARMIGKLIVCFGKNEVHVYKTSFYWSCLDPGRAIRSWRPCEANCPSH